MSTRNVIEHALNVYYADSTDTAKVVSHLLDAHRSETLTEGINALRTWDQSASSTLAPGLTFAIGVLMSVRDDRTGEEATAPAATATPDFFQKDHTYTREHHGRTVEFRVRYIDTAPDGGYPEAFGWRKDPEIDVWLAATSDDLTGWTDTTTGDTHA